MRAVELLEERFQDEPGKDLAAYLSALEGELERERATRRPPS
jgi:hypothetical protein